MNKSTESFHLSKEYLFLIPVLLVILTWTSVNLILTSWMLPSWHFVEVVMSIVCLWGWYKYFFTAYHIYVKPTGSIVFTSIHKTSVVAVQEIISIRETFLFVVIEHNHGQVWVSTLMDRIGGFKSLLLSLNPSILTKYTYYRNIKWK